MGWLSHVELFHRLYRLKNVTHVTQLGLRQWTKLHHSTRETTNESHTVILISTKSQCESSYPVLTTMMTTTTSPAINKGPFTRCVSHIIQKWPNYWGLCYNRSCWHKKRSIFAIENIIWVKQKLALSQTLSHHVNGPYLYIFTCLTQSSPNPIWVPWSGMWISFAMRGFEYRLIGSSFIFFIYFFGSHSGVIFDIFKKRVFRFKSQSNVKKG